MTPQSSRYFRYFTYIKPITKMPIVKTYGSLMITLIGMLIFILFAIKPTTETILVLQKKLADSNEVLTKVNQKAQNLSLGKKNYDDLGPNVKKTIQDAIPDNAELKTVVSEIEMSVKENSATISALQIQPLTIEKKDPQVFTNKLDELTFTANIEGEYPSLLNILQAITKSPRIISIDNLNFTSLNEGESLLMSISAKAYYLR